MRDADAALVARLRAGEEAACREFVDAYRDRILSVVSRILGSSEQSEDLAQETFLKAFRAIDRFEGQSALFTWLYRIAVNTARDELSTRRRRPTHSIEGADGPLVEPEDTGDGPAERLVREERIRAVRAALERLPEPFRTTLILRDMEGNSYEQVAEILGISIGTVESRIFRARCKLRVLLGGQPP
ncbi:MAG: RNA polymerase sigma factor [Planctomycetota bacterium]